MSPQHTSRSQIRRRRAGAALFAALLVAGMLLVLLPDGRDDTHATGRSPDLGATGTAHLPTPSNSPSRSPGHT